VGGVHRRLDLFLPAVANGVVYVGSDDDNVYAFPASCSTPCSPLWTGTDRRPVDSVARGGANVVVYVGSGDGKLYAYSLAWSRAGRPFPYGSIPNYSLKSARSHTASDVAISTHANATDAAAMPHTPRRLLPSTLVSSHDPSGEPVRCANARSRLP